MSSIISSLTAYQNNSYAINQRNANQATGAVKSTNQDSSSPSSIVSLSGKTFLGAASDAQSAGDVSSLMAALQAAGSGESSVYGANGLINGTASKAGWDVLMGNDSSSSNADSASQSDISSALMSTINTTA